MSSSIINYQGYGFWSDDRFTRRLVAEAAIIAKKRYKNDWLVQLADHWELQASSAFAGWMHLKLDEFVTTEGRGTELCEIVKTAANRYPANDPVNQTAVLLVKLLEGKVQWTVSSPLDYMIGRNRR
jgi:hypothetical protein